MSRLYSFICVAIVLCLQLANAAPTITSINSAFVSNTEGWIITIAGTQLCSLSGIYSNITIFNRITLSQHISGSGLSSSVCPSDLRFQFVPASGILLYSATVSNAGVSNRFNFTLPIGATVLPTMGALYYIRHVSGNKYIHPQGGWDQPLVGTKLLYHNPAPRTGIQFQFFNSSGLSFVKHYLSQRFCYPTELANGKNIVVGNQTIPNSNQTLTVKLINGMTYLTAANNYYIHPEGGSAEPVIATLLVVHTDFRTQISIDLVPAEEYEILGVTTNTAFLQTEIISTSTSSSNPTPVSTNKAVLINYNTSLSSSFKVFPSAPVGILIDAKSTLNIANISFNYYLGYGASSYYIEPTTPVRSSYNEYVTIPAMKRVKVTSQVERKFGLVPFTLTARSKTTGQITVIYGNVETNVYVNQQTSNTFSDIDVPVLSSGPAVVTSGVTFTLIGNKLTEVQRISFYYGGLSINGVNMTVVNSTRITVAIPQVSYQGFIQIIAWTNDNINSNSLSIDFANRYPTCFNPIEYGVDFLGTAFYAYPVSYSSCAQECCNNSGCKAFTWTEISLNSGPSNGCSNPNLPCCYLKSQAGNKTVNNNGWISISAEKP